MNCRRSFVLTAGAAMLGLSTLAGAAVSVATEQDPSPREIRDRLIQVLTQMQELNTFQRNIGFFSESHYTPRQSSGRINTSTVYFQLPGKRRKEYDFGDRMAVISDGKRSLFTTAGLHTQDARIEPVMATLLDITVMKPESWIRHARSLGIDTEKYSEQEWNEKTYIVIGSDDAERLNVPQIWIEKDTHRPARAIMYQVRGSDRIFDYRLMGYETFEDGSVFPNGVEMYEGPYRINHDSWSRFEVNREANDDFFSPEKIDKILKQGGPAVGVAGGGGDG